MQRAINFFILKNGRGKLPWRWSEIPSKGSSSTVSSSVSVSVTTRPLFLINIIMLKSVCSLLATVSHQ